MRSITAYARWCQLVATACCVCRIFRAALLGPGADALWPLAVLSAAHPVLTAKQSRGLNRMLAAQGHRAYSVDLTGRDWDLNELHAVTAALTGLRSWMVLSNIHSTQEAGIISRTLSTRPIASVDYSGTAACLLPVTAQQVKLDVTVARPAKVQGIIDQAPSRRFLGCLRPLRDLQVLELHSPFCRLTHADVQCWAERHPKLQQLHLTLADIHGLGRHSIESLHLLSSVDIILSLQSDSPYSLSATLRQLQGLQLAALMVYADEISPANETLLASCSMQQLGVMLPDPTVRLRQPPAGVPITYSTEHIDDDDLMSSVTITEST